MNKKSRQWQKCGDCWWTRKGSHLGSRRGLSGSNRRWINPFVNWVCSHNVQKIPHPFVHLVHFSSQFERGWCHGFLPNFLQRTWWEPAQRNDVCPLFYSSRGPTVLVPVPGRHSTLQISLLCRPEAFHLWQEMARSPDHLVSLSPCQSHPHWMSRFSKKHLSRW